MTVVHGRHRSLARTGTALPDASVTMPLHAETKHIREPGR